MELPQLGHDGTNWLGLLAPWRLPSAAAFGFLVFFQDVRDYKIMKTIWLLAAHLRARVLGRVGAGPGLRSAMAVGDLLDD